jgi:hypothetical protein
MLQKWLTALGYAIGKGIAEAIIEDMRKPRTAEDEKVNDEDKDDTDNIHAFIGRMQQPPHGDSRSDDSPQDGASGQGSGMA